MTRPTITHLRHPLFRGSLQLHRLPLFLRFTCRGMASCSRNWDALDQLDDTAEDGEQLIAAKLVDRTKVHLDRVVNGRRVGEWIDEAVYEPVADQPSDAVLRDNEKWREWAMSQPECPR